MRMYYLMLLSWSLDGAMSCDAYLRIKALREDLMDRIIERYGSLRGTWDIVNAVNL
jgi:hypothetical protein